MLTTRHDDMPGLQYQLILQAWTSNFELFKACTQGFRGLDCV